MGPIRAPYADEDRLPGQEQTSTEQRPQLHISSRRVLAFWPKGSLIVEVTDQKRLIIGRTADCDVRIDDPSVSRRHAVLHFEPTLCLEDCGSTNGTKIGAARVPSHQTTSLTPDSPISIGSAMLVLQGFSETRNEWDLATTERQFGEESGEGGMGRINKLIDLVAKSVLSVLIVGETGVGKEVAAERLHASSPRASGPLVKINCAALPETLLESELFGYEKGAFTGAQATKMGLVEAADQGTLFLDEVGEIPLATQAKLLRTIEAREVLRLGALKPRRVDVRFIAATNRDLEALSNAGSFRSDLYFRLNGITIHVPPLRERAGEIAKFASRFAEEAGKRMGTSAPKFSEDAIQQLLSYRWPGNLRELRNVVERAVVLADGGRVDRQHILLDSGRSPEVRSAESQTIVASTPKKTSVGGDERQRIIDALARSGGNQTEAAKLLGISRRTLVDRLDELDIPRPRKSLGPKKA